MFVCKEKTMIKDLIEKVKERELSLGTIMVLIGVLVWIIPVKLVLTLFVIYGLVLIFWKKEDKVRDIHHHHHHNGNSKKKVKKKSG
jgi:hypothetical protein